MKKPSLWIFAFLLCLVCSRVFTNQGGPQTGVAGDPPLGETCAESGCHSGVLNGGTATATITVTDSVGNTVSSYDANHSYLINYSIHEGTKTRYGFESIVRKSGGGLGVVGTLQVVNSTTTRLLGGSVKYAQHTSNGTDFSSTTATWQMKWTAPNGNYGNATVYAAFNASNKDGQATGDKIYTRSLTLTGMGPLVGLKTPSMAHMHVQYNTVSQQLVLNIPAGEMIRVFTLDGKQIATEKAEYDLRMDIASWLPGIYILITQKQQYKFIKY